MFGVKWREKERGRERMCVWLCARSASVKNIPWKLRIYWTTVRQDNKNLITNCKYNSNLAKSSSCASKNWGNLDKKFYASHFIYKNNLDGHLEVVERVPTRDQQNHSISPISRDCHFKTFLLTVFSSRCDGTLEIT